MQDKKRVNSIFFTALYIILGILLIGLIIYVASRPKDAGNEPKDTSSESGNYEEEWQEGIVSHNGKTYKYNYGLNVYLFLGIDKEEPVETAKDYLSGGQSDAMFLLITNRHTKELSVISINRNTMTRVLTCQANGLETGYATEQICVQHGFGDGKELSCKRTVEAVSNLFYNLPIDGYLSINMGAVPAMNDAIGGVEVTVLNDISYPSRNVELKEGQVVTLNGNEAYAYLRGRDTEEYDSASLRLRRQEQYINAYFSKISTMTDGLGVITNTYKALAPYIVSNMDFLYVAEEIQKYEYSSERMYTIPGETVMGEIYEEYHVDEKAFFELILDVFYEEVTKE